MAASKRFLSAFAGLALMAFSGCEEDFSGDPRYQNYGQTEIAPESGTYLIRWDAPDNRVSSGVRFQVVSNKIVFANKEGIIDNGAFEYRHGVNLRGSSDSGAINPTDEYVFEGHFTQPARAEGAVTYGDGGPYTRGPYTFTASK